MHNYADWSRNALGLSIPAEGYPQLDGHVFAPYHGIWVSQATLNKRPGGWLHYRGNGEVEIPTPPASASRLWKQPETITEEIIAYRAWKLQFDMADDGSVTMRLRSLHYPLAWDGPVQSADSPPAETNDRGLYGMDTKPHHSQNWHEYVEDALVWGEVALSGIVVEGGKGYRAERMTVRELWLNPHQWPEHFSFPGTCKVLGERYQCEVSVRIPNWVELCAPAQEAA